MDVYNGIFHVTSDIRVNSIGRTGLIPGSPMLCTDKGKCAAVTREEEYVMEEDDSTYETMEAEKLANRVLNEHMPDKFKQAGASREAVFFYPTKGTALETVASIDKHANYWVGNEGCIVEVASKKIPCRSSCVVAPVRYADEVFARAANAVHTYDYEEDEEATILDKAVDEFWEEAELLTDLDKVNPRDEIFCPCRIPPEAIKQVHGCPVKRIGKQYTLHAFAPRKRKKK